MRALDLAWRAPLAERSTRWALGLAALLHVIWATSMGLSPDEAHYALYGQHLAWSYYDHPPLVGWLQSLVLWVSDSDLALRWWPLALWWITGSLLLSFNDMVFPWVKSCRWWGLRVDAWLWLGSVLPHLMGLAMVPDALLMPLTLALMHLVWRLALAQGSQTSNWGLWLALGLGLGLAGLSKYTAVLLALSVMLSLQLALGWSLWRNKGWGLALITAAMLVSVVFIWNAFNDWASFRYQLAHAKGAEQWHAWMALRYGLVLWLGFGFMWPLMKWAMPSSAPAAQGASRSPDSPARVGGLSPERLCGLFALPLLLVLLNASGRGSALPHWAVSAGVALLPWVSALWARGAHASHTRMRAAWGWGLVAQVLLMLVLAAGMSWGGMPAQTQASTARAAGVREGMDAMNPVADLHGWQAAALHAADLAKAQQLPGLAVTNWSLASRLAWYARPWSVRVVDDHGDQFNIWFGRFAPGDSVLWVDWSQLTHEPPQGPGRFATCRPLDRLDVVRWGRTLSHFHFYRCENWQGS